MRLVRPQVEARMSILVWTSRNRHIEWDPDPKPQGPFLALPERVEERDRVAEIRAINERLGRRPLLTAAWILQLRLPVESGPSFGVVVRRAYENDLSNLMGLMGLGSYSAAQCWCASENGGEPAPERCPAGEACAFIGDAYDRYAGLLHLCADCGTSLEDYEHGVCGRCSEFEDQQRLEQYDEDG
jgi:hypothetical protein